MFDTATYVYNLRTIQRRRAIIAVVGIELDAENALQQVLREVF